MKPPLDGMELLLELLDHGASTCSLSKWSSFAFSSYIRWKIEGKNAEKKTHTWSENLSISLDRMQKNVKKEDGNETSVILAILQPFLKRAVLFGDGL
jgi:hypothetical protein